MYHYMGRLYLLPSFLLKGGGRHVIGAEKLPISSFDVIAGISRYGVKPNIRSNSSRVFLLLVA